MESNITSLNASINAAGWTVFNLANVSNVTPWEQIINAPAYSAFTLENVSNDTTSYAEMESNITSLNASINAREYGGEISGTYGAITLDDTALDDQYCQLDDWTSIDDYPSDCTNEFVYGLADTLTCSAVTDEYLDLTDITLNDFTNDAGFLINRTDAVFKEFNTTQTNVTLGNVSIIQYNSSCAGFRFNNSVDAGGVFSCMP